VKRLAILAALTLSCGPKVVVPPPPPPTPMHLEPACDLAPAAGVRWVIDAKPRQIAEIPDLIPAIGLVLPEDRLKLFAAAHGGMDLRQIRDLCIAQYKNAQLDVAVTPLDPEKLANAFDGRLPEPAAREVLNNNPKVLRLGGHVVDEDQRLVVFGVQAAALERGVVGSGPLRAAEAFAFMRLHKAQPALKGAALKRAAEVVGEAPMRAFAAGPFEGEVARGLGGILRATTAVGASAAWTTRNAELDVRVVLIGAWGEDGPAAAERLAASANVLGDSAIGRLFGFDKPIKSARAHVEGDALVLEETIDGNALAKGLHDALDADVADIMRK
jgi:hypothetical protein